MLSSRNQAVSDAPSRRKFSHQEDRKLQIIVQSLGSKNWEAIAKYMSPRTARQCRDRFQNYLIDSLVTNPWTPEEDAFVIEQVRLVGPKWVEIGKVLSVRSGNDVKNRWHKHLSKLAGLTTTESPGTVPENILEQQNDTSRAVEKPGVNLTQIVGISDCTWEQIFSALEKDSFFQGSFSLGGAIDWNGSIQ
jgi:hypothetical protein